MVTRDVLGETVFLEGYHAVFTGNRNGGAPHLQGRQEPKGTLLSSCRMRQTTAKLVFFFINAPLRRRRLPTTFRTRKHKGHRGGRLVARRAMASSKADEIGRSPRAWSAACTTQASSTWAGRRIWYARPSVRWLRAPSKLCALTNERLCLPRGLRRFRR